MAKSNKSSIAQSIPKPIRKSPKKKSGFTRFFDQMATKVTRAAGRPAAFIAACVLIILWAVTGPIFHFSDTWQLVINTGTTIITFLMVFVIQQTQNKDTTALQLKLNELIASSGHASNSLVNIEDLTEEDLDLLKKFYIRLSELSKKETGFSNSHSYTEAEQVHLEKLKGMKKP
jgi:low affinity Fe/Cu permease